MSSEALAWALRTAAHEVKSPARTLVLVKLADYAGDEHTAWPNQKRIAKELGWAYSTVRDHLGQLCAKFPHLIRKEARYDDSGRQTSNFYRLNVRGDWQAEGVPETRQGDAGNPAGEVPETQRGGGAGNVAPRGAGNVAGHMSLQEESKPLSQDKDEKAPAEPGLAPDADAPERVRAPAIDFGRYAREWNDAALVARLPLIEGMNLERRRKLRVRLAEPGFDWPAILAKLPDTIGGWLHKERMLDYDFITKNQKGYTRLLEGRYDGGQGAGLPPGPATLPEGVMVND